MKRIISLVLATVMLCSIIVMPVSAQNVRESLLEREVQYIDILSTARAGTSTPAFRDSFKKDASLYSEKEASVFTQNRVNTTYHEILNAMWVGFGYTQKASFSGSNQTVHFLDITNGGYEVLETGKKTGSRAKTINTNGVISYEKGADEEYNVNYYKFGDYKIGPVSVEDDDPATDVFYSPNSILLGGSSTGASVSSQTFENLNIKGKYLKLLLNTINFEGDASVIPVKVDYTTGDAETFYVFTTKNDSADRLSTFVKVLPKKASGSYTQQELVDNNSNFEYLTAAKREELGITAKDLDEITFDGLAEGKELIFPEKTAIRFCNRNKNGAVAKTVYIEDVTLPIDLEREVSKVTITNWFAAVDVDKIVAPYDERLSTQKTTVYHKLTIPGYKGDNEFYALFGRTCQQRTVLLGMSVLGLNDAEKIEEINEKIEKLDVETATKADCDAIRAEIAELKAGNADIVDADFNLSKIQQIEKRIEDEVASEARKELLNKTDNEYVEIPYTVDGFATAPEVYKYFPRDSSYSIYPTTDVEGNAINNHINATTMDKKTIGKKIFVIESILGNADGKLTGSFVNESNAVKTYNVKLKVNGNNKFALQSTEADGAMNFIYTHKDIDFKMGPVGGTGAHLTAEGGYNVHLLGTTDEAYNVKGTIKNHSTVNILMSTDFVNSTNYAWAGFYPVKITYADGNTDTKYLLSTILHASGKGANFVNATGGSNNYAGDGDRLAKTVIYVPEGTDVSTGSSIASAEQILSETNSAEIVGRAITLDDVKFPNDDLIIKGEAALFGDYNHARTNAFSNARQYCPVGYVDFLQIPVEGDVASIMLQRDIAAALNWKDEEGNAAVIKNGNTAYIPVTIEGASEDYLYFAKIGRLCQGQQEVYAVTITGDSLNDKIAGIERRIQKLSNAYVAEELEEINAIKEEIKKLTTNTIVLESDFNKEAIKKLNFLYELHSKIDEYADVAKELVKLVDALPEKYSKEAVKPTLAVKKKVEELVKEGITEEIIKSLSVNYEKYERHLATYNEWLNRKNTQDRIVINWTEKDSAHAADIFEFSEATVEQISEKQGIVMSSTNTVTPGNVPYGSFIGFYSTTSAKNKYKDTFPNKYNEYYITNGSMTYGYSGISENIGENKYNAGMVSQTYGYEIPFDGVTPYEKVSLLVNGITFLSGEYARQLQAVKTKVYFTDGTTKEELSFVGPFGYGYKIALYSMLEGDTLPYSEYLSNRIKSNLSMSWHPEEANVDSYFSVADNSIRVYYKTDKVTKATQTGSTLGLASSITIDTNGKAVEKVSISYATENDLKSMGAFVSDIYIKQETKDGVTTNTEIKNEGVYYVPIDKAQLKDVTGYDENRDYYIAIVNSLAYPAYLHGVTGVRKTATSYAEDIADIENEIKGFSDTFDINELNDMKEVESRIRFLEKQGVAKESFDSTLIAKLEALIDSNVSEGGRYEIYVSPDGNDNGYGYKESPVQTLERARTVARTYTNDRPIDIILLEGEHKLSRTFELSAFDSGTEENPVTIKGAGGVITAADTLSYYDFEKVSEKEAKEKLQPKVIGKVLKLDLDKYGVVAGPVPQFRKTAIVGDGFEDVTFFVNNKEQSVAQYPNGESNYETWEEVADASISAVKIRVNAKHAKKWQGEKFAYFEGYPSPDYSNERNNIKIEGDLLCFQQEARFDADENHSRRYKVKHVLYELDTPGEWYIDRDANVLYYYPTSEFNEDSRIQIVARKINAITSTTGLSNFNFDGVKFDKIRGTALAAGTSHDNVNVYNCEFTNISNMGVQYVGRINEGSLINIANYIDAAKNCEIRNNRFINIGNSAIRFTGGNRSTLSDGNNVIANNYIYNASDKQKCNPDVYVTGAKNYVLNNEIHMGTFHAINHSGNDNVIAYNELYNMLRDTGDCGVIYNGRQLATRGTEIAYNYIHDYKHLDSRTHDNGVAVYLDDRLSGISIHHNIIFSNGVGEDANGIQNGGGQHNKINYNTIVDADEVMTRTNRLIADYLLNTECTAFNEIIRISGLGEKGTKVNIRLDDGNYKSYEMLGRNEFYFERYPEMNDSIETLLNPNVTVPQFVNKYPFLLTLSEFSGGRYGNLAEDISAGNDLTKYSLLSLKSTIGNEYIGNVSNTAWRKADSKDKDGNVYDVYEKFGSEIRDNVENADESTFVDYANQDFRIKGSTNGGALDESFDLDTIGIQEDGSVSYELDFELKDVQIVNPKTGLDRSFKILNVDASDKSNVYLEWERVAPADYFTVEIATDANMSNIIYRNEDVYFTRLNVNLSEYSQDTFYFRVIARNIARYGSQWTNEEGVQEIKTLYAVNVDLYADVSVPFDISSDFNVDVFNNEGETHNNKNNLGSTGETLGMYNLTNLKKLVPANGYYKFKDTTYYFPQVGYDTSKNNAVSTEKYSEDNLSWWDKLTGTKVKNYTYTLKSSEQGYYDKIKIAMSADKRATDYKITVNYTDNSSTAGYVEIHQYYTTYYSNPGADVILTTDGVNYLGQPVSRSNLNKIYEAVIDTDINKIVKSITFEYKSGTITGDTKNDEYIFAISGVTGDRTLANGNTMQVFSVKNYTGAEKNVRVIVTGYVDGEFTTVIIPATIKNNKYLGALNIEMPEKVKEMTERAMFIWDNDPKVMKAYTTKLPIK